MSPTHLEGVWHNQYGSEMRIAVSPEGRLTGRYRTGGAWTVLGTLYRSVSFTYDVDEVVGLPVAP